MLLSLKYILCWWPPSLLLFLKRPARKSTPLIFPKQSYGTGAQKWGQWGFEGGRTEGRKDQRAWGLPGLTKGELRRWDAGAWGRGQGGKERGGQGRGGEGRERAESCQQFNGSHSSLQTCYVPGPSYILPINFIIHMSCKEGFLAIPTSQMSKVMLRESEWFAGQGQSQHVNQTVRI